MNGLKTWLLHDLVYAISKKQFQSAGSIARVHNTAPSCRFWSFFEFSKSKEQYLNRTKENESSEEQVDFRGTLLAYPRPHMPEQSSGEKQATQDVQIFDAKLDCLKNVELPNTNAVIEDGFLKTKIFEKRFIRNNEIKEESLTLEAKEYVKDANTGKNRMLEMKSRKSELTDLTVEEPWYDPPQLPSVTLEECPFAPKGRKDPEFSPSNCDFSNDSAKAQPSSVKSIMMKFQTKSEIGKPDLPPSDLRILHKEAPFKNCSEHSTFYPIKQTKSDRSNSMNVDKSVLNVAKERRKCKVSFPTSVKVPPLQTTKSLPDQVASRYSFGIIKPGFSPNSSLSRVTRTSMQSANMSSRSRKRNKCQKKQKKANVDCTPAPPPPCCPPPPPPCCPPPPPPCCPPPPPPPSCPPPPDHNQGCKRKVKKVPSDCQPQQRCFHPPDSTQKCQKPKKKKKRKPENTCRPKTECYTSKCPKRKKRPPKPRICPPKCFEPDPCDQPKAFCVQSKKKPNDKCFSTWALKSDMAFTSRHFASDACKNVSQEGEINDMEKFNKRIPKPGPSCKETMEARDRCKSVAVKEPKMDKCPEVPINKKSCQESTVSAAKTEQEESVEAILRKELEETQRCKKGKQEKTESDYKEKNFEKKCGQKIGGPSGLERVISPCKLERIKKSECKYQETKSYMIPVQSSNDSPFSSFLTFSQMQENYLLESPKNTKDYFPLVELRHGLWSHLNVFDDSIKNRNNGSNINSENLRIKDQKPRKYWFTTLFH